MRRTVALALAFAAFVPTPALALTQIQLDAEWGAGRIPFRDVPADNPFFEQISKLKELKLTQGTGAGFFEPDRCVSKAEVVKFALDAAAVPVATAGSTPFADLPTGWQKNYVEAARAKGMLPQVDTRFDPNACASRIFSLLVILRAAKVPTPEVATSVFADVTAPEQMAAVEVAKAKGIVSGRSVNAFAPYDTTLRKEMAKILVNTYQIILHPEETNDRRPDYDTAVRIQTIIDNLGTILTANGVSSTATPTVTRFAFVDVQYVYVDYTEGTTKKRVLLDITKPDANFRIAVVAAFTTNESGVYVVSTGTDSKKDSATTVYLLEGTLWLKQAAVAATEQLFSNTAGGYTLQIPKAWFYWNRGVQGDWANEALFATSEVSETNWTVAVRVKNATYATVAAADTGSTAEENLLGGVLRTYADGSFKAFLPHQTSKTLVFEAKASVTKAALTTIIQSLKSL